MQVWASASAGLEQRLAAWEAMFVQVWAMMVLIPGSLQPEEMCFKKLVDNWDFLILSS